MSVIIYSCRDQSYLMLVKRVPQPQKNFHATLICITNMRHTLHQYRFLHLRKEITITGAIVERDV